MDKKFTFKLFNRATGEWLYYINVYNYNLLSAESAALQLVNDINSKEYLDSVKFKEKYILELWQVTKTQTIQRYETINGQNRLVAEQVLT